MKKVIGIKFPFSAGIDGIPQKVEDLEAKRSEIIQILKTRRGERVMRPTFGSNLWNVVFEDVDIDALRALIYPEVVSAITSVDPTISVSDVRIDVKDTEVGKIVEIEVDYIYSGIEQKVGVSYDIVS